MQRSSLQKRLTVANSMVLQSWDSIQNDSFCWSWDSIQNDSFCCGSGGHREAELGWPGGIARLTESSSAQGFNSSTLGQSWPKALLSTKMFYYSATWFAWWQSHIQLGSAIRTYQFPKFPEVLVCFLFFEIIISVWILWEFHRVISEHIPHLPAPSIVTLSTCLSLHIQLWVFFFFFFSNK